MSSYLACYSGAVGFQRIIFKFLFLLIGKLLSGFRAQSFPQLNLIYPYESMEQLASKPPNNDNNKEPVPPLPPKTYQCKSELN